MKRITVLLSAAILCLCLTACSKEPEPKQNPQEIQTELADIEKGVEAMPQESITYSYSGNEAKKNHSAKYRVGWTVASGRYKE